MEWKIGEIFEYNGEWYQCLKSASCDECAFNSNYNCMDYPNFKCSAASRTDNCSVIFKKLKKVGEPITVNGKKVQLLKTTVANCDNCAFYKGVNCDFTYNPRKCYGGEEGTYVEIKTKEDMNKINLTRKETDFLLNKLQDVLSNYVHGGESSEIESAIEDIINVVEEPDFNMDLKPFDLNLAKAGKPVCTRDGMPVRIICFDAKGMHQPIVALVTQDNGVEYIETYYSNGRFNDDINSQSGGDLMMLPEKKERWINIYRNEKGEYWSEQIIFSTKKEATDFVHDHAQYVTTIKITWEE